MKNKTLKIIAVLLIAITLVTLATTMVKAEYLSLIHISEPTRPY